MCIRDRFHVPGSPALFVQCFSRTGWQNSGSRGAETEQTPRTAGTPAVTLSIAEIKKADDRLKYNGTFQTNTLRDKRTKNKQQTLGEDTEQTARAASTHAVTLSIAEIRKADDRLKYNSTFQTNTLKKQQQQTLGEDTEQTARAASTHAVTV